MIRALRQLKEKQPRKKLDKKGLESQLQIKTF